MSDAQQTLPFWKRRLSRGWLAVPVLAVLLAAGAGAVYAFYPSPADVLASMWPLRTQVLASVRGDSPREALPALREWDAAAARLPLAVRLYGQPLDGDMEQRIEGLRGQLASLRASIERNQRNEIPVRATECLDAHRALASLFNVAPPASVLAQHDHGSHGHHDPAHAGAAGTHAGHQHGRLEIRPDEPVPTVEIAVTPDLENKGWNLRTQTSNFRFAPDAASGEHVPGEGHAHLYVDGKKVTRLYGEWHFLGTLAPGRHVIQVTLNSNDHNDYVHNGEVIAAETTVTVPGEDAKDELCRNPESAEPGAAVAKQEILFGTAAAEKSADRP